MYTPLRVLVVALLLSVGLAGCLGGEDAPAPVETNDGAEDPTVTEETGAVKGQLVTEDLDEVPKAGVALVAADGSISQTTESDKDGRYTFNGISPGSYKVQVTSICCKAAIKAVDVKANDVAQVDFQLTKLSLDDLQAPYATAEVWEGFISCGVGTAAVTWAACATAGDPNMDFLHTFAVTKGLQDLVIGVRWQPVGGVTGTDMWVNVEDDGCGLGCPDGRTYAEANQGPDIVFHIDEGPSTNLAFDNITDDQERLIQMRVFPGGDVNVMYQQPFTVYWHAFYWGEAPEDFNPFPDI